MAKVQAFSSVSVSDITDVGSLNFYCTSNLPNSVIYDPNQNGGTYSPNWASTNLKITPVISYNGQNLALNATGLTITFTRREGTGDATALTTGETVSGGVLTVKANKLSSASGGQLTYVCKVVYRDPDTGIPIEAEASLTYSLVKMASELKTVTITGENAFLYDTGKKIVGSGVITLTADFSNCQISQWQYKKSDGTFAAFPNTNNPSITERTLTVRHDEQDIWINGKTAIIRVTTNDPTVFDLAQIVKIEDGAAGNATVAAVLSNENHVLSANSDGSIRSWAGSQTEIHIYEGGTETTSNWTISVTPGTGLEGTYDASTHIFTPSALTGDSSYADFNCTRTGYSPLTKRFVISKQYSGQDGKDAVIYEVEPNSYSLNLSEAKEYTPSAVTFNAYTKVGNALVRSNYSGRFIISESTDGTTFTTKYTSKSNENSTIYTPSNENVLVIRCVLYASDGTTQELDTQSVVITRDGATGEDGQDGTDGLSMGLGNYSDVIPCDTDGAALAARDVSIPFYAYKGITRVPVAASVDTLPIGVSVKTNSQGTEAADGMLVLTIASGATFGSATMMTGDITIGLTALTKHVDYKYTWTKSKQAPNGVNAVLLRLMSDDGGNVEEGKSTTITAIVNSGMDDVTQSATFVWKEFKGGQYTTISGQTGSSITITPQMVTDQMWLKCEATYKGKTYSDYRTIDDVTDPISAVTRATIAEFKNSQGFGAIYTRVYRNGTEVDPIKTTTFTDTPPSSPVVGDYYYHLDRTNKSCVLKKYTGSEWINATTVDNDTYVYSYYRVDNKGDMLDSSTPWKTGRAQYVDPSIINGRMQFFCEVSEME